MNALNWLADAAVRAAALVILTALFVRTVSRNPAALRHLAWTMALGGVLVIPLLARVVPWKLPLLPADPGQVMSPAVSPIPRQDKVRNPETKKADSPKDAGQVPAPGPKQSPLRLPPVDRWLPLVWLAGVATLGFRLVAGFVALARIRSTGQRLDSGEWTEILMRACDRVGIRTLPDLLLSDRIAMPCTAGWFRPVILLPSSAVDWDQDRLEVVLLHELAHVKRRDFLPHLLAQAVCALHWFNPLVWIAAHRMRSAAELACDDLVLEAGARPSEYAAHLLEIVRGSPIGGDPVPAVPMAHRSEFEGRLLAILESTGGRGMTFSRAAVVTAAFITTAVLPVAAVSATAERARMVAAPAEAADGAPVQERAHKSNHNESTGLLVATLNDSVPSVRHAAAEALGSLKDTLAVRALIEVLRRDTDAGVRRAAAWALGEIEDARAVPALTDALRADTDLEVRRNAAWALGSIEDVKAVPALSDALRRERDLSIRKAVIEALGSIEDASAVPGLLPGLKDEDPEIRRATAEALGSIEDTRSVEGLMAAARDDVPEVRRAIIDALGSIEDRRAAPVIAHALSDTDVEVRRAAADAIGSLDELRNVPRELIAALNDSDADVRHKAIEALGNFEDPASVGPLVALIKDQDVEIRRAVIEALDDIDDPAATRALREALKDEDPEVRRMAAKALGSRSK